jgi:hypothetical protein
LSEKSNCKLQTISYVVCQFFVLKVSFLTQEAKYVERWPNMTSAWAAWSRFDIPVDRYVGVHSLLICTSSPLESPTCHQASQHENTYCTKIKKLTGPALWLLCVPYCPRTVVIVYSTVYSMYTTPCTHNRPPPRQYSHSIATSDISSRTCLIISLTPFCFLPITTVFMTVKQCFSPDLKENSCEFFVQDIFAFKVFMRIFFYSLNVSILLKAIL